MNRSRNGGPARFAGPLLLLAIALACGAGRPTPAHALDWIPPRPFTAVLPSATLAPSSSHALSLTVRANGPGASLVWGATCVGSFACGITPASGILSVPSNGSATLPITVTLPDTALGAVSLTVTLLFEQGGGIAAKAGASVQAASAGRPEIKPVPSTMSAPAGTAGSVAFQLHSTIGTSELVLLTAGRFNPDANNVGAHFAWGSPPSSVTLPAGGTVTVNVPVTLSANAYGGNLNSVQLSATSNGGLSNAIGNALVSASSPGSLPTACFPVGLTPLSTPATGRDGPTPLTGRGYWLIPTGLEGVRVVHAASTDSIGVTDANGDGGDDRIVGTIRIPSYAASVSVIPGFITAHAETLDVGLLAAGRAGLMLLDLRMIEDPTFGTWEDFFDTDQDGVDDRILRTIPLNGFATDVAWFRAASGRVVALVAAADTGSVPVETSYNPALTVPGTGAGVVAIDVRAALDSLGGIPYAAGTLATPGSALDLEVRGGGSTAELAVADGTSGVSVYGLSTAGGAPATVTFTPRGAVALSSAWGTPYARDLTWVSNTRDSLYVAVAAVAGGVQVIRAPRGGGAPSLALVQQTAAPAIGLAGAWTGTLGVAMGAGGVALMRVPVGSELNKIGPGAPAPYAAPVVIAQGAPWGVSGPLQVAAHQGAMSAATSGCFEATVGPLPDLLVSDGERVLVLRPGTASITAVDVTESPLPSRAGRLRAAPNPSRGMVVLEARLVSAVGRSSIEIGIYDVQGRLVRRLRSPVRDGVAPVVWDGHDASGLPVASGRYWARLRGDTADEVAIPDATPIVILR